MLESYSRWPLRTPIWPVRQARGGERDMEQRELQPASCDARQQPIVPLFPGPTLVPARPLASNSRTGVAKLIQLSAALA